MKIEIIRQIPFEELEKMVRGVPLKEPDEQGNQIFPYRDTTIEIRRVEPDELNPATFYFLKENIQFQKDLRLALIAADTDTLELDGGIEYRIDGGDVWRMIPPIVELTEEPVLFGNDRGDKVYNEFIRIKLPVVVDGANRCALAKTVDSRINVLFIKGVPYEHPFYALPNEWERIQIYDVTPPYEKKKFYRRKDIYALYRDFGVLKIGTPRSPGDLENIPSTPQVVKEDK